MRKHPVLFGIFLLCIFIAFFFLLVYGISAKSGKSNVFSLKDKVGVVIIDGVINESRSIVELMDSYKNDESIKAVVLRINSPGGGVASSQEIYEAIVRLKGRKKVVASMGSVAASGGYLIACAADKIVANPGTITGSISALIQLANIEDLLEKIGLRSSVIKSGKFKDIGSPARKMTQEEIALLQGIVDDIYDQLLDTVTHDRNINKEELRKIADGRIFTGRQAVNIGLVDELGDMEYAIRLAGNLAGIKEQPDVIYPEKKRIKFWQLFLKQAISILVEELKGSEDNHPAVKYIYSNP